MPKYIAALTIVLLIGMVFARVLMLRRRGIEVVNFGKTDKTDFLIPPFALLYFYLIFAHAFSLPSPANSTLFQSEFLAWFGVLCFLVGLTLLLWSLISFGRSFRVGIDVDRPDSLVTTGAFAVSRNPIYVAFALVLIGQFLVFPYWVLLVYLVAAFWLFNRQVLREEEFLKQHYGQEFAEYCKNVRRYL